MPPINILVRPLDFPKAGFPADEEALVAPGHRHSLSSTNRDAAGHSCNERYSGGTCSILIRTEFVAQAEPR